MSRSVTAVMRFQADFSDLDASLDAKIRQITKSPVGVPVSQGFGGPLGGSGPTSTLSGAILPGGGVPASAAFGFSGAGAAGASSPNLSFFTGQLTRDVAAAITQAIGEATRTATRGAGLGGGRGSGLISFQGEELTREQYAARGADLRSAAFARAAQWNRVDAAVARAKLSQNLARTAGTYADPGAALDEAISEGAAMEEAAYPRAIAAANYRPSRAARAAARIRGIGRLAYRFGAVYTAYESVNAAVGFGINSRLMGVAGALGTQADFEAVEARRYEGVIGAFGPIGALADLAVGGSATIASNQLIRRNDQASFESGSRMAAGASAGELARARLRQSTQLSGVRNPFDVQKREAFNDLQNERLQHQAEMRAMARQRMFYEDTGDYRAARAIANEIDASQTQYERTEDVSLRVYGARNARIEADRGFANRARSIGFSGLIASNLAAAANNPLGSALTGIRTNAIQQLITANAQGNQQDYLGIVASAFSEGFKESATAARAFGVEVTSLQGSAASASLRARHMPLEAQLRDIETQRRNQMTQVPTGFLSDLLGGQQIRDSINDEADALRREARTRRADQERLIDMNLATRGNVQNALLRRSILGAETAGIAGRALSEAEELGQGGFAAEARTALQLGIGGIRLSQREALESFHGVTLPAQNFETRDLSGRSEDFTKQLQESNNWLEQINQKLDTLMKS